MADYHENIVSSWLAGWIRAARFVADHDHAQVAVAACHYRLELGQWRLSDSLRALHQGMLDGLREALGVPS